MFAASTYYIHNLLKGQAKLQSHRMRLIHNRPLKLLVLGYQIVEKSSLIGSTKTDFKQQGIEITVDK